MAFTCRAQDNLYFCCVTTSILCKILVCDSKQLKSQSCLLLPVPLSSPFQKTALLSRAFSFRRVVIHRSLRYQLNYSSVK